MSGYPTAQAPRPSSDAPGWAVRVVQDLVDWIYAIRRGPQVLTKYTVAASTTPLPDATKFIGAQIYVSDETGGAVPAFSDGTNWRRVTDRAIVS